ncbi:hypothetical protein ACIQXI_17660 [Lysinibacillus sp. NPDC097195]|uniref:hypothetical protein n=1 Tax=Lysinibacillus sp. NPDC097195 TaxID=3364141 RepID=UPI00380A5E38
MDLINAYIYEVIRKLAKNKRDAIKHELQSTIEEMLPADYTESEVKEALLKLGDPAQLALNYQDGPNYLIGPQVYRSYLQTIKVIIPWAILITLIVHLVKSIWFYPGDESLVMTIIQALAITIANLFAVIFQVLFWVTIVFIIMERYHKAKIYLPFIKENQDWTPEDLIVRQKNHIPISDIVLSLLGLGLFTFFYFNASNLIGIYSSDDRSGLRFVMPLFNQDILLSFKPIILCWLLVSMVLTLYKWKVRKWTMPIAITSAALQCFGIVIFMVNQPSLIHSAAIPYMAAILETTSAKMMFSLDRLLFICIVITIGASVFDIYSGFKKAKVQ